MKPYEAGQRIWYVGGDDGTGGLVPARIVARHFNDDHGDRYRVKQADGFESDEYVYGRIWRQLFAADEYIAAEHQERLLRLLVQHILPEMTHEAVAKKRRALAWFYALDAAVRARKRR